MFSRDIFLGTWNVRSLYRAGSLTAAARELARYKLDLVGVQDIRWEKGGTVRAGDYNFLYRRMRWARHVARMGEGRVVHRILVGKPEGKRPLGRPNVDGRTLLRWIFRKWEGVETGWSWLRIGTTGGGNL